MSQSPKPALLALGCLIPSERLLTDAVELLTYEVDASFERGLPDAVVFPETTDEVIAIVRWANEHQVSLIARGAGTGLSGGAVAERGGVIVEFARMDRVVEIDAEGRSAVVQPGVVNLALDKMARSKGLYFPPDPASGRVATIGGNIAENAGGPHCFKYGVTTNYVTGLQVVLADGRCVQLGGRALDYPEYDLTGLMTGSEGTCGLITEASVRLIRAIPAVKTLMVAFDSVKAAGQAVSAIIARGLLPATLEMMDQQIMRIVEKHIHAGLPVDAAAALIIEVDGYPASLSPQMDEIVEILGRHRAFDLRLAKTAQERDQLWYARKSVGGSLAQIAPAYIPIDGTVPRSKIADALGAIASTCSEIQPPVAFILHAGDGNLHPHLFIKDPTDRELVDRVLAAARRVMEVCVQQGGSITGEHGVGIEKRSGMELMHNAQELWAMREVKAVFDPDERLNPGKILPRELPRVTPPAATTPLPRGSFAPTSLTQVADVFSAHLAAEHHEGLRIRGGGTKSALLPPAQVTLSTQSLKGIVTYAPEDLYVTVNAGTSLVQLQTQLREHGVWVPLVSPWEAATVGGIVASNANAPLRMRYGGVRDLVLAVTAVLPDGRVIRAGRPVVKNVAGYDLTKLFVGSHGTLGLIGEVALKIAPLPRAGATLMAPMNTLEEGLRSGYSLLAECLEASAILLCRGCESLVEGGPARQAAAYCLFYTTEGLKENVAAEMAQARGILQTQGATGFDAPLSGNSVWARWMRAVTEQKLTIRVGVAPKDVARTLKELVSDRADLTFIADIANGHIYIGGNLDIGAVRALAHAAGGYTAVLSAPGNTTAGLDVWGTCLRPANLALMRALKERWDPRGRINPGAFAV